jgi:hypothetical protein
MKSGRGQSLSGKIRSGNRTFCNDLVEQYMNQGSLEQNNLEQRSLEQDSLEQNSLGQCEAGQSGTQQFEIG